MKKAALAVWLVALAIAGCGDSGSSGTRSGAPLDGPKAFKGWKAEAAMISNIGVYREREFVYQDYIYDDHGANTDGLDRFDAPLGTPGPDPNEPVNPRMSPAPLINWAGDFTYAAPDGGHQANVADLIEFRVAADARDVQRRADHAAARSGVQRLQVDGSQPRCREAGREAHEACARVDQLHH